MQQGHHVAFGAAPQGVEPAVGTHPDHSAGLPDRGKDAPLFVEGQIPHVAAPGLGGEDRGAVFVEPVDEAAGRGADHQISAAVEEGGVNGDLRESKTSSASPESRTRTT